MKWTNWVCLIAIGITALLAGCGAGGGGGAKSYTITLRADRTSLPLNIGGAGASIGGQYTTTLYVEAKDSSGHPVPGGDDVIGCAITGGLDSGALYYLDGDPEHETTETIDGVEVTFQNAYRSITLPSNAGASSFHFHTTNLVGTTTIRCTVTETGTSIQRASEVSIQVGGPPSGKVSQIVFDTISPNYLVVQGVNGPTQVQIQANLVDEAGQVVTPPAGANDMQIRIVPNASSLADNDATLRGVNAAGQAVAGSSLHIRSINGKAQFTLVSGTNPGTVLLEALGDRADNNIGNGVGEAIFNLTAISVVSEVPSSSSTSTTPLSITTTTLGSATGNIPYGALLEASGGTVPYTWSIVGGGLPTGISLSSSGVISGVSGSTSGGTYSFVARVRDATGATVQKTFTVAYSAAPEPPADPVATAPTITTTTLAQATQNQSYATAVTATGGTLPYSWTATGLPAGLAISSGGVISGTPTTAGTFNFAVTVMGNDGLTSSAGLSLTVVAGSGGGTGSLPTLTPTTIAVSECTTDIPFIINGGTGPFISFSTDSINVPTTTPVVVGDFYVFTVSTSAGTSVTSYTVTVLDALSRAATATIGVPNDTHTTCPNNPKLTLSPTTTTLQVGGAQVVSIQGGGDGPDAGSTIDFVVSSSDPLVASVGAVTGPTGTNAYIFTVTANAVGTVIVRVSTDDGQNTYIPVFVVP